MFKLLVIVYGSARNHVSQQLIEFDYKDSADTAYDILFKNQSQMEVIKLYV